MNIKNIGVIGAGTMGRGVTQLLIKNSFNVCLFDTTKEALLNASCEIERRLNNNKYHDPSFHQHLMKLLTTTTDPKRLSSVDIIIEAVPEKITLKRKVLAQFDRITPRETIFCSNTSGLDIDSLASVTTRPERVIGMHFFNPAVLMPLIELVRGTETSDATFETISHLSNKLGKKIISVANSPGFVVNRILFPMINEAIRTLEQGVANATDIDNAMRLGASHPIGPLSLADFIGLDVALDIMESLESDLKHPAYKPSSLLRKKVKQGHLGRKTGRGFFSYD